MDCIALQSPLSMEFSRQEYWSGLPFPPLEDCPNLGSNPCLLLLLHWKVDSLPVAPPGKPAFGDVQTISLNRFRKSDKKLSFMRNVQ